MKIPCIYVNSLEYLAITPQLKSLGYNLIDITFPNSTDKQLLVLNYNGEFGKVKIISLNKDHAITIYDRVLTYDLFTFIFNAKKCMDAHNKNNINKKSGFTKSDLKSGMVVQTRDGNYYIIIKLNDTLILSGLKSSINGSIYKNDLTCDSSKIVKCILDIIKVYVIDNISYIDSYLSGDNLKEIWSRSKVINITTEDLKKFKSDDSDIIKLKLDSGEIITIE